jgi:hypothetical protein
MAQLAVDHSSQGASGPPSAANDSRAASRLTISARFLLGIYAIVPLCLLIMAADYLFTGGYIRSRLPNSPDTFLFGPLLFGTPHIIASSVILATNVAYLRAYWLRLLLFTVGILLFFGGGNAVIPYVCSVLGVEIGAYEVFLAVVGGWTVLHVIKQQTGLGKGLCRYSGFVYEAWGWTLVAFGSIIYFAFYHGFSPDIAVWIHRLLWVLAAVALALTVYCHTRIPTAMGRLYLWGNALMVLQGGLFYTQGYSFLAILAPRLVHDVTAFAFYVVHDVNRHRTMPQNLLYGLVSKLGLGIVWVCPVVAVLLTFLIGRYMDPLVDFVVGHDLPYRPSFLIVGYLALLHYYTEAFTWRKGSPYRQYVAVTA